MGLMNKKEIDYMSNEEKRDAWDEHHDQWQEDASMQTRPWRYKEYTSFKGGPGKARPWWFTLIETLLALALFAAFVYFATK